MLSLDTVYLHYLKNGLCFYVYPIKSLIFFDCFVNLIPPCAQFHDDFETFKKGIYKVKDYLFTFLSDFSVPYDNNASERGIRKIKVKQKVSGCFRTDDGADIFAKIHSIAETAKKNGNSKFEAILGIM